MYYIADKIWVIMLLYSNWIFWVELIKTVKYNYIVSSSAHTGFERTNVGRLRPYIMSSEYRWEAAWGDVIQEPSWYGWYQI